MTERSVDGGMENGLYVSIWHSTHTLPRPCWCRLVVAKPYDPLQNSSSHLWCVFSYEWDRVSIVCSKIEYWVAMIGCGEEGQCSKCASLQYADVVRPTFWKGWYMPHCGGWVQPETFLLTTLLLYQFQMKKCVKLWNNVNLQIWVGRWDPRDADLFSFWKTPRF